jgi:phage FluMu gp28-like protein
MSTFRVPRRLIEIVVEAYHAGTDPYDIQLDILERCRRSGMTAAQAGKCVAYALKVHRSNQSVYRYVNGSIGGE